MTIAPLRPEPRKPSPSSLKPREERPRPPKFSPWKGWGYADHTFRPHRPVVEMTQGLARLHGICKGTIASEEVLEERVEKRIDRWIQEGGTPLGSGAFAQVVPVFDALRQRPVAGKMSKDPGSHSLAVSENECKMLHLCQHMRHVIRFYGGHRRRDPNNFRNLQLVMDRVSSDFLKDLESPRIMPLSEILSLFQQLLEFHSDASDQEIIHRDLHPQNFSWEKGALTVYDFGRARFSHEISGSSGLSFRLDMSAPEVLLGKRYDESVDLWSIGCIIYEAYTKSSFIDVIADLPNSRYLALGQIFGRIGEPPPSCYFDRAPYQLSTLIPFINHYKDRVRRLSDLVDAESRRRGIRPEVSKHFIKLLQGIFRWEDRITPKEALALCEQLIQMESPLLKPEF